MRIAVLGAGAWGTALALSLCPRHQVTLWIWDRAQLDEMRALRENARFLPGFPLPDELTLEGDAATALTVAEFALVAVPTSALRETFRRIAASGRRLPVVWASKGFEAESAKLPHQVAEDELTGSVPLGVLSGPSFALEVAQGQPTAVVAASTSSTASQFVQQAIGNGTVRVYTNDDVIGVELGGALKNVMAVATGIAEGVGLGLNSRAALITRGLAEMTRLGVAVGARPDTFAGL
ncbi:MAG: NAD(P)H-dependent glycerol-3-phosphate dehydrogenase, partial [Burkholderiales bacterium]